MDSHGHVRSIIAAPLAGMTFQPPGARIAMAEWEAPAEETVWIAPLHIHHQDDEFWYILEGNLAVLLDGVEVLGGPGDCIAAVRGVAHSYRNAGPGPLRYILVMPERIRGLIDDLHGGPRDEDGLRDLFTAHASEFLGWPKTTQ